MNIWLINDETPEANNLSGLHLTVTTQSPDHLTFTQHAYYDAEPLYEYLDTVTLKRGGVRFFEGQIIDIVRQGSGSTERIEYTIAGPWWQLDQIIVEQSYLRRTLPDKPTDQSSIVENSVSLARIILGTDIDGLRRNSGQVITDLLSYALTEIGEADALFQIGTIGIDTEFPAEEVSSITAGEAIRRVLRWNPDVVAYFDYATIPATLHFRRRSALSSVDYSIADVVITGNTINPRHDLQRDGVIVKYERVNTYDGAEYTEILTDTAGNTTDPFRTLKLYFDLQGQQVSIVRQDVVAETIQKDSAAWWQKHLPHLANATGLSVTNATQTPVDDGAENDGTELSRELISGSIAEWMSKKACAQIMQADLAYTLDGESKTEPKATFQLVGTDATSREYTDVSSFTQAEPAPAGLAASIFASLSSLSYEGTLTLQAAEAPAASIIDKTLNIIGGRLAWASMHAQIYRVAYNLDSGQTQVNFGPAKHLGPDDLFQLYRNTRQRKPSSGLVRLSSSTPASSLPTRSPNTIASGYSGSDATAPLQAYKTGATTIKIKPGTVDGVVVTAADESALDAANVEVTVGYILWLKITLASESGSVSAAIMQNTDPGADTNTQGSRIALKILSDGAGGWRIQNHLSGSQDHDSCGSDHSFILS